MIPFRCYIFSKCINVKAFDLTPPIPCPSPTPPSPYRKLLSFDESLITIIKSLRLISAFQTTKAFINLLPIPYPPSRQLSLLSRVFLHAVFLTVVKNYWKVFSFSKFIVLSCRCNFLKAENRMLRFPPPPLFFENFKASVCVGDNDIRWIPDTGCSYANS